MKWFEFTFEDGYKMICRGLSKIELQAEVRKHGRLISKIRV